MSDQKYILGLDLGVGSVGWACVLTNGENEPKRILDLGVRIFEPQGESMEDRRIARGTRRVLRRRKARVTRIKTLFRDFRLLSREEIDSFYGRKGVILPDPYEMRLKGKTFPLSNEELFVMLVHYAKGRGFKSNRKALEKVDKKTASANEEQKLLYAKKVTEETITSKKANDATYTLTNYLFDEYQEKGRMRNTSGDYLYGITRELVAEEISAILTKQIELGIISQEFMNQYLDILLFQRSFTDGPDHGPYHKPLERMIGLCGYTGESRAARSSLTYEKFTLVQKLLDIRYQIKGEKEKKTLDAKQIAFLLDKALNHKDITYKLVKEAIGVSDIYFSGLQISKKDYMSIVDEVKKDASKTIESELEKKKDAISIFKLKCYINLRNSFKKTLGKFPVLTDMQYDLIAECLTRNKSDSEIQSFLAGKRTVLKNVSLPVEVADALLQLEDKDYQAYGKLSFSFLYQVLPLMIEKAIGYYEAALEFGFNTAQKKQNENDFDQIPVIDDILEKLDKTITNKSVIRTLVESRKIVNAVIHQYGKPYKIHIEMARELTKSEDERMDYIYQQQENQYTNDSLKNQIFSKFPDRFRSIQNVSGADLIQYKLFIEQGGICPYALAVTGDEQKSKIHERELFTAQLEVDHIVPYSLSFDDRFVNKALVKTEYNQQKGNKLPSNTFKNEPGFMKYRSWIQSRSQLALEKRSRYLAYELDDKLLNDYRARTINDTRYAIKAFKEILQFSFPNISVKPYTGQITAKLRGVWGLNNLTHSYQSANYIKKQDISDNLKSAYEVLSDLLLRGENQRSKEFRDAVKKINGIMKEESIKNRENHLHHAVDAAVIACATDKIRRNVEIHQIFLRTRKLDTKRIDVKLPVFDENGELQGYDTVLLDQETYLNQIKEQNLFESNKFPLPYNNFRNELIFRVYERDESQLQFKLMDLEEYKDINIAETKPIFISHHYSSKLSGRLHKATFYGMKELGETQVLTNRMAVNSEKFDSKKCETIYDKENTQSYIYRAVKDWLGDSANGKEAFERRGLPKNKNGNAIKKVKLNVGTVKEEFEIKAGSGQYVEKENVVQVHIYQNDHDGKLYFVGMDRFRLLNSEKRDDLSLVLWSGQAANHVVVKKAELPKAGFTQKPLILMKGQTILVELKSGSKGLCKIVGFTSGQLEIESIIGDNVDLLKYNLFQNFVVRYKVTISTIQSLKPISISVLGKLESNVL